MPTPTAPVPIGALVGGKYRVERVLGAGGMGVVVAATHVQLDRAVALKFLQSEAAANAEVVSRFTREAKAAGKIHSEHVARVLDVGALDTGEPYLVMEYLDGEDLARVLTRRGPLPIAEAVDFVLEACEAVAEAHALGIVHRDLKPANLFLATRPSGKPIVKVLDFGISKTPPSATDVGLTTTSSVVGSPLYMSPEQMTSARSVDARSDLWSLGVVLHELLTGAHPFPAESVAALVLAVNNQKPRSTRVQRDAVPEALAAAVMRCLLKDPLARFASIGDFAEAIAPFGSPGARAGVDRIRHVLRGSKEAATSQPPAGTDELAPTVPAATPSTWTPSGSEAPPKATPRRAILVGAGVLLVAGAAVAVLVRAPGGPAGTEVAPPPADPDLRHASAVPEATPLPPVATLAPAPGVSLAAPPAASSAPAGDGGAVAPAGSERPKGRPGAPAEQRPGVPKMELR